jgi:ribonuclease E
MAKRMLIDATHPEETRVVVLNGNRLEEFDFESSTKQQVKGNIYLAKVTRVEPSLQAAFVEYGGNRQGFLAFSEIHPDYYRIPIGDRELIGSDTTGTEVAPAPDAADQTAEELAEELGVPLEAALPEPVAVRDLPSVGEDEGDGDVAEPDAEDASAARSVVPPAMPVDSRSDAVLRDAPIERDIGGPLWDAAGGGAGPFETASESTAAVSNSEPEAELFLPFDAASVAEPPAADEMPTNEMPGDAVAAALLWEAQSENGAESGAEHEPRPLAETPAGETSASDAPTSEATTSEAPASETTTSETPASDATGNGEAEAAETVETIGGDDFDEAERQRSRLLRHYKIQEVVKRRQIMLVQVVKEERGTKGAALTTYLSLAGRYCVLMPNTARGGGVSRKITSLADRRRLKDILEELDIPEGMGVIVRTAGAERSKAEIRRDYEYLLRLWNEIRELTLRSTAPALIYEEGNLIKRSIRDLYSRDIDDVVVEGEEGYRTAKAFMKMLMPSHAKRVQPYRDSQIGLFHRFQVEGQIDAIHAPSVQLRSGGYIVINQTEALVAIDVNSGRATRERNIEETALRTNLEAAEEIARQLRLRDLAGLIVIDFIDMEEHRNQFAVERRLKDTLKNDRARIQVGRISPFGLLEMSRQRLRPSLAEASTQPCPHCGGTGVIRSTESTALYVLRSIEEEGMRRRAAEICVYVPTTVALYILNNKRLSLTQLEARYGFHVLVARDDALIPPAFRLERLRALAPAEAPAAAVPLTLAAAEEEESEDDDASDAVETTGAETAGEESGDDRRRRNRRRRRRRRDVEPADALAEPADEVGVEIAEPADETVAAANGAAGHSDAIGDEDDRHRRRRGRRGGRRRLRHPGGAEPSFADLPAAAETVEILPTAAVAADEFTAADEPGYEPGRGAPKAADAAPVWATEPAAEFGPEHDAHRVEAASLPALAGDAALPEASAATDREDLSPTAPHDDLRTAVETIEIVAGDAAEAASAPPPGVAGNGIGQQQAALEAPDATPEAALPSSAPPVQTVTEKPANPRRGWWQRLMQP